RRRLVTRRDLVRLLKCPASETGQDLSLETPADLIELRDGALCVIGELQVRPGAGNAEHGDAIGRADSRADELRRRVTRVLLVAGRDVLLVEDEDIEMAARRRVVVGHFGRDRA